MSTAALDLRSLVINGQTAAKYHADLLDAVTDLTMTETITGASTVKVTINDPHRTVLKSPLMAERTTMILDDAGFELAAISKQSSSLTLTFEDIAVAALRRHTGYRTSKAGTTSRAEFCTLLAREEPAVKVIAAPGSPSKVALSRGSGKTKSAQNREDRREAAGTAEDSWTAMGRIMGEIGWRVFCRRGTIHIASDQYLIDHATQKYTLSEVSSGVDNIDFDWDVGKPAATATITCRAGFRSLQPGAALQLERLGVGNGGWLVESIDRSPFTKTVTATAVRPQPTLPEPTNVKTGSTAFDDLGEGLYQGDYLGDLGLDLPDLGDGSDLDKFIAAAQSKIGHKYVWGASGPDSFDCSGFVYWCAKQVGINFPKPAAAQYARMKAKGTLLSVADATSIRGAVLVRVGRGGTNHIVISMGNGTTVEAMGRAYGVRIGRVAGRVWTSGGYIPGLKPASVSARRNYSHNITA